MKKLNYIFSILLLSIASSLSAQDTTLCNKGTIHITSNTKMTVLGNSINNGVWHNGGDLLLNGSFRSKAGSQLSNSDTISITGNWFQLVGQYNQGNGTINFNGVSPQTINKSNNSGRFYNIVFSGGGTKTVNGFVLVDSSINFINGRVLVNNADTFALLNGTVYGGSFNSFVDGYFYREGFGELFYPVGVNLAAPESYRPVTLTNVPTSPEMPILGMRFNNLSHGGSAGENIQTINPNFFWRANLRSGDYFGSTAKFRHYGTDALVANQAVVAQSNTINGKYYSIGGVNITASEITSQFNAGEDFYTFGRSANMTTEVSALLQDNMLTADTMNDHLYDNGYLNQFTEGNANSLGINMLAGYQLPMIVANGPVDYIALYLRATATGANLDTSYAWLMTDGSIRDFYTGTKKYATFKNYTNLTSGSSYFVVVDHRNHLPAMHTAQVVNQDTTGAIQFNFANITNIYGAGAFNNGSNALLYSGNADVDKLYYSKYIVDANDFDKVRVPANNSMPSGYLMEDVNLDGTVNGMDWDITKEAVDNLHYSTVPF